MSVFFRVILIVTSIFFFWYIVRKIRKSQLQIEYSIFWIGIAIVFIIFSFFPEVVNWLTNSCGMIAPSNFLFLLLIFILLYKVFLMSVRIGILEEKIKNITQQVAIQTNSINHQLSEQKDTKER